MSYTSLVKGSSPVGYWKLNGSGSAEVGSSASISNGFWSSPPLVVNSGSALTIKPLGASVSIYNSYNAFYKNFPERNFTIEFWMSFNGTLDGSGYLKNLNSNSKYFSNNKLDIISIYDSTSSVQVGRIYYDYLTNTFKFGINGSGNTDAYLPVRNLNTSFYVVAQYNKGSVSITVNGEKGMTGSVIDSSLFPNRNSSSVYFNINGSTINPNATINYSINDLAMYDYLTSIDQQRLRVVFALDADKPAGITNTIQTSYFDISEKDYQIKYREDLSGKKFEDFVHDKNYLVTSDIEGITSHKVNPLSIIGSITGGSVTYSSASGVKFTASAMALQFDQYGTIFQGYSNQTVSCQIIPTASNTSYIFSITNSIDNNRSLYLSAASNGFELGSYDHANASATQLYFASTTLTAGQQYDVALCIDEENVYLYTNNECNSVSVPNLKILQSSNLLIGNLSSNFLNNTLYIKNFGMTNELNQSFIGFDITQNKMLMARLTENLDISQMITLIKNIPLSSYGNSIIGSKLTWDGMDNCSIEISDDAEQWSVVQRGNSISTISYRNINNNKYIRFRIPYEYSTNTINQSFNNFSMSLYQDLSIKSNDGNYLLLPGFDDVSKPSYNIKRVQQPILLRQDKIGIYFDKFDNYVNGYGVIINSSSVFNPYAMDFWLKIDSTASTNQYLIGSADNTGETHFLYVSGSTNKLIYSPSTTAALYINGASIASNSFTASAGEYYHMMYIFNTASSSLSSTASIYINSRSVSSASTHANGSYGHLNIWNYATSSADAASRYNHFIAKNSISTTDVAISSSLWQPNWQSDAITTASSFKIG